MGLMHFLSKQKRQNAFVESAFECKRDTLTIRGIEYRPAGDNLPIAIVSHGFMAFQDTVRHYAKALASLGYCAYCFDFCGGSVIKGKSDGDTREMSVLTEVRDLEAVIAYTQSLPYTGRELLLMGCSQGGFVSALVAAKCPNLVSRLALFYPALCIRSHRYGYTSTSESRPAVPVENTSGNLQNLKSPNSAFCYGKRSKSG